MALMNSKSFNKRVLFLLFCYFFISCNAPSEWVVPNKDKETINIGSISHQNFEIYTISSLSGFKLSFEESSNLFEVSSKISQKYDIPVSWVLSIQKVESNFNSKAISFLGIDSGCGIMQISDLALKDYNRINNTNYSTDDLFDIEINIEIGCWMFKQNLNYGVPNDYYSLLSAYNLGHKFYLKNQYEIDSGKITIRGSTRNYNYPKSVMMIESLF